MTLPIKKYLINLKRVRNSQESRLGYLRLDKNESPIGFSEEFIDILKKEISSDFLSAYPETEPLYEKISKHIGFKKENIYISAGSDAAIKAVFEVFVQPNDPVLLLSPTYAMYYVYVNMFQGKQVELYYNKDLSLAAGDILEAINKHKPKLICIANPNSPTGTVFSPDDIKKIADIALSKDSIVLLDEAYYPFYSASSIDLVSNYRNLIVTRTFSKAMALASARLGFAVGKPRIIECLYKVRPMYETNAFAVKFAELILDNYHLVEKNVEAVKKGKGYLEKELKNLKMPYFETHTNFTLINVGSFDRAVQLGKFLYKRRILIKAGFGNNALKNCIRVSIGSTEQMGYFVKNFKEFLRAQ